MVGPGGEEDGGSKGGGGVGQRDGRWGRAAYVHNCGGSLGDCLGGWEEGRGGGGWGGR